MAVRSDDRVLAPVEPADDTTRAGAGEDADSSVDTDLAQDNDLAPGNEPPSEPPSELPRALTVADIDCAAPSADNPTSLNNAGEAMLERHLDSAARVPTYELIVDINPVSGEVAGAMRAHVPAQERTINFRAFAGMDAFDSGFEVDNVTVDGEPVDAQLDRALLSVPAASVDDDGTTVELDFRFTIDQLAANTNIFAALSGESLQPDQVGLLGRTDTGMQLGHWFPVWLPDGTRTDPDPSGFGDIGAFPAANICTTITVPSGYQVVTSGSRIETTDTSVVEAGAGLRDFSILISNDLVLAARVVRGIEVRVWGPADDPEALATVLEYAEQSHDVLNRCVRPLSLARDRHHLGPTRRGCRRHGMARRNLDRAVDLRRRVARDGRSWRNLRR